MDVVDPIVPEPIPAPPPPQFWLAQYDGNLKENTLYPCADCRFPGLTRETAVWKWGVVRELAGPMGAQWGYVLVCRDPRDCWRRAEFMGTADWIPKSV